jgi:membrane protein implicated in regulation of membrane protease activity
MTNAFLVCAVVGGTLLVCQFVLSLLGIGDHGADGHDVHVEQGGHDHGDHAHGHGHGHTSASAWFFSVLTFRSVVSALTFFGLAGLAASSAGWPRAAVLGVAAAAGVVAMFVIAAVMRSLVKLQDEGNLQIQSAVGQTGTVYLTVPGNKSGVGKVTLSLQNRTTEFQAVTFQDQLPTGSKVVVVDVIGPETVEVIAAPQYGRMAHV